MNTSGGLNKPRIIASILLITLFLLSGVFIYYASINSDASTTSSVSATPSNASATNNGTATPTDTNTTTTPAPQATTLPATGNTTTTPSTSPTSSSSTTSTTSSQNQSAASQSSSTPSSTTSTSTAADKSTAKTTSSPTTPTQNTSSSSLPRELSKADPKTLILNSLQLTRTEPDKNDGNLHLHIRFALPFTHTKVTLQIDNGAFKATQESDDSGFVSYTMQSKLSLGTHRLSISGTNPLNSSLFSASRSFIVEPAKAASSINESIGIRNTDNRVLIYITYVIGMIIIGITLASVIYKHKRATTYQLMT